MEVGLPQLSLQVGLCSIGGENSRLREMAEDIFYSHFGKGYFLKSLLSGLSTDSLVCTNQHFHQTAIALAHGGGMEMPPFGSVANQPSPLKRRFCFFLYFCLLYIVFCV